MITWFEKHRLGISAYLEDKRFDCTPDKLWWFLLLVIHDIVGITDIALKYLQGRITLLCNHNRALWHLVIKINYKVGIIGKL